MLTVLASSQRLYAPIDYLEEVDLDSLPNYISLEDKQDDDTNQVDQENSEDLDNSTNQEYRFSNASHTNIYAQRLLSDWKSALDNPAPQGRHDPAAFFNSYHMYETTKNFKTIKKSLESSKTLLPTIGKDSRSLSPLVNPEKYNRMKRTLPRILKCLNFFNCDLSPLWKDIMLNGSHELLKTVLKIDKTALNNQAIGAMIRKIIMGIKPALGLGSNGTAILEWWPSEICPEKTAFLLNGFTCLNILGTYKKKQLSTNNSDTNNAEFETWIKGIHQTYTNPAIFETIQKSIQHWRAHVMSQLANAKEAITLALHEVEIPLFPSLEQPQYIRYTTQQPIPATPAPFTLPPLPKKPAQTSQSDWALTTILEESNNNQKPIKPTKPAKPFISLSALKNLNYKAFLAQIVRLFKIQKLEHILRKPLCTMHKILCAHMHAITHMLSERLTNPYSIRHNTNFRKVQCVSSF